MKVLKGILVMMAIVGLVLASGAVAEKTDEETVTSKTSATDVWLSRLIGKRVEISYGVGGTSKTAKGTVIAVGNAGIVLNNVKGFLEEEYFFSFGSVATIKRY